MNGFLLDTHVLVWWMADDPRLGPDTRTRLANPDSRLLVSAASVWEMSIKRALGKLRIPDGLGELLDEQGFEALAIEIGHAEAAGALPMLHRDPFDRMLVAQAVQERLVLITSDAKIAAYDVTTLDAST